MPGVYPRVCGGTMGAEAPPVRWMGLSPRVRGNLGVAISLPPYSGSIPACAGEPYSSARQAKWRRVYPRVCGGTESSHPALQRVEGLSPRVRGNPAPSGWRESALRSIPACAGEPRA